LETTPRALYDLSDVFVELGVAHLSRANRWLRDVAARLAPGPDLVATLDAFYLNDMNRSRTASSLHLHPRTLDYRLQRVRELTGVDPGSVRGIRILTAVTGQIRGGAWT
jgi:sugar diacid utilization regulator